MNEKNIIIIDTDNETTLKIKSVLESEGYIIHNTSGKTESLTLAKKLIPSLIFINIAMRDVSGLEIAKAIHDTDTLSRIPIVIITPHGGTVEPRYTEMYGIVDFLKRSFTPEELISKVIDITETRSGAEKPDEKEIPYPSDEKPIELREETAEIEIPIEATAYSRDTKFQSVLEEEKETVAEEQVKQDEGFTRDARISESLESQSKISSSEEKSLETEPSKEDNKTDIDISHESATDNILEEPIDKKKSETKSIALIAVAITVFILIAGTGIYLFSNFHRKSVATPPIKPSVQEKNIATSKIQEQEKTTTQPETITDTSKVKPTIENQQGHPKEPVPVKTPQKTIESADKQKIIPKTPAHSEKKKVKQFYSVQFGVFKNEKFAKSFAKELSKNNYNVFIEKTTGKNNSVLYRVLSQKYKNKKEAEKHSKEILTKNKIQTVIYKITEK